MACCFYKCIKPSDDLIQPEDVIDIYQTSNESTRSSEVVRVQLEESRGSSEVATGQIEESRGSSEEATGHIDETQVLSEELTGLSAESLWPLLENLKDNWCTLLLNELQYEFIQSASQKFFNIPENYPCPTQMQIQGSAADGFLLNESTIKSDIDFLYSMEIFNHSMKFKRFIINPNSPAHVKIEVIPDIGECTTDIQNRNIMSIMECIDNKYILNIKHIKNAICKGINDRLENCSTVIKSEGNSCFRIELNYDISKVLENHLTKQIEDLNKFSEEFLKTSEFDENIKELFKNLSGSYFVEQLNWNKFQEKVISLDRYSSEQGIINILNNCLEDINVELSALLQKNILFWNCFNITENCFYLLLSSLVNCGLYSIVDIINSKMKIEEKEISKPKVKLPLYDRVYYEKIYFTPEDINNETMSSFEEPMTNKEKEIEKLFYSFLVKSSNEIKISIENRKKLSYLEELPLIKNDDLTDEISKKKWLSSIIKMLVQFLKTFKHFWTSYIEDETTPHLHTVEVIPGLNFNDWPDIASGWITRLRHWPKPEIIEKIINNGYHVVFKSLNKDDGYDGRISFSGAETIMCQAMTPNQIIVFYLIKQKLKAIQSQSLKSYYIKTICFWVFELTPIDDNSNMQETYLQEIIKYLFTSLKERTLQHYFIPQHNLFNELQPVDFEKIIERLGTIDSPNYLIEYQLEETKKKNPEPNISNCFKLIENVFFSSINETFENIIIGLLQRF